MPPSAETDCGKPDQRQPDTTGRFPVRAEDALVTPVVVPRRQSHPLRRNHRPFAQSTRRALSPLGLRDHWYLRRLLKTRRHESSLRSLPVTPLRRWLSTENLMTELLRIASTVEFSILRISFRTNDFCVTWYLP